jgi:mRNA interferase MazF
VLTRDPAIPRMRRVTVAPCTGTIRGLVSEVPLDPEDDPVPQECVVNLDSVQNVPVETLVRPLGRLSGLRMREVCAALALAVDCRG